MEDKSKDDIRSAQIKQIAALSLDNVPEYKIAKEMNLSRHAVRKLRNSDEFKSLMQELGDHAVANAKEQFKSKMEELAPLAFEALKHNLAEKKIEAVRVFIETVGLKDKEVDKGDTGILQVIFPGQKSEVVVPTQSKVIEEEDA